MNWRTSWALVLAIACNGLMAADAQWDKLMDDKTSPSEMPIVTNRAVTKSGKWHLLAPMIGIADRADLHSHLPATFAVRRFFSESHAWEVVRVNYDMFSLTDAARDVIQSTGYVVDSKQAYWSISTGYVWAPIYGKYAFSDNKMVHFDAYLGLSLGMRFASSIQITAEPTLGMVHYLTPYFSIILPEIRLKLYSEQRRNGSSFISEFVCQTGVGWLF